MTGLSRAGFYRWRTPRQSTPVEMELRDQMQKIAVESPAYGYRRITAELQKRGFDVNRKRVLRMMREDNLLCVRRRLFVVTTDSCHSLPIYPNLAREMNPAAINQLWVADITSDTGDQRLRGTRSLAQRFLDGSGRRRNYGRARAGRVGQERVVPR